MLATYMQHKHNNNQALVIQKLDNTIHQAPVVKTLDSAIRRLNNRGQINHYPPDKCKGNQLRYPVDSDLSGG